MSPYCLKTERRFGISLTVSACAAVISQCFTFTTFLFGILVAAFIAYLFEMCFGVYDEFQSDVSPHSVTNIGIFVVTVLAGIVFAILGTAYFNWKIGIIAGMAAPVVFLLAYRFIEWVFK